MPIRRRSARGRPIPFNDSQIHRDSFLHFLTARAARETHIAQSAEAPVTPASGTNARHRRDGRIRLSTPQKPTAATPPPSQNRRPNMSPGDRPPSHPRPAGALTLTGIPHFPTQSRGRLPLWNAGLLASGDCASAHSNSAVRSDHAAWVAFTVPPPPPGDPARPLGRVGAQAALTPGRPRANRNPFECPPLAIRPPGWPGLVGVRRAAASSS